MRTLKIKYKKCNNKLGFVRLVKECTRLGLKESKDIADKIWENTDIVAELKLSDNYQREGRIFDPYKEFTSYINDIGEFEIYGGLEWERDLKMLSLSVGEQEDYIDFLADWIKYNKQNDDLIKSMLSKIKKEDLVELVKQIKV